MKKTIISLLIATSLGLSAQAFANGATLPTKTDHSWYSHMMLRLRGIAIVPDASSSTITTLGGHVTDISKQIVPELDISYFFTKNISAELILATAKHKVTATGTALGRVPLGSVWLLPPTLVLQYHFLPDAKVDPYIGAGVNYTYFYNSNSGPVATKVDYQNSWGPALDVGADIALKNNWSINVDVKKVWIDSHVRVTAPGVPVLKTKVKIDPWIFGLGLGYRFS